MLRHEVFAAWIIPLGMAYIGDVTPYERRQQVLGRYLSGQITGQLFGQAAGGVIGDLLGWRAVFFVLAAIFAVAALALFRPDGQLNDRATAEPEIAAVVTELSGPEWKKVRNFLTDRRCLAFLDRLQARLTSGEEQAADLAARAAAA